MTTIRSGITCLTATTALILLAATARAAIPGADDPDARTYTHVRDAHLAWYKTIMIDRYRAHGRQNPAWDEPVIAFLEAAGARMANQVVATVHRQKGVPTTWDLAQMAERIEALGCDDPMVRYLIAWSYDRSGHKPVDFERFDRITRDLVDSKHHPIWQLRALKRARNHAKHVFTKEFDTWWRWAHMRKLDAVAAMALEPDLDKASIRIVYSQILAYWWRDQKADAKQLICDHMATAEHEKTNPWLRHALRGKLEIDQAWDARGGGWAHEVTEEGWAKFKEHLEKAYQELTAAWRIDPTNPHPAGNLITVAMGGVTGDNESERYWFEQATKAQFDFTPAYTNLLWALRPRWNGSHEQMIALGEEALATDRFDTDVPWFYFKALLDVQKDTGQFDHLQQPGTFEKIQAYFEKRQNTERNEESPAWNRSLYAVFAARAGRWDVARQLLDELSDQFMSEEAWRMIRDHKALISTSEIYSRSSDLSSRELAEAEVLALDGRFSKAVERLEQTIAAMPDDDPSLKYLNFRLGQFLLSDSQVTGRVVRMTGQDRQDLWIPRSGQWTFHADGSLTGVSGSGYRNSQNLILRTAEPVRTNFTVSGTILHGDKEKPVKPSILLALYTNHRDITTFGCIQFSKKPDQDTGMVVGRIEFSTAKFLPVRRRARMGQTTRFTVTVWGQQVRVTVDDQVVMDNITLPILRNHRNLHLGLGAPASKPGVEVRFADLELNMLIDKPDWAQDD